MVVDTSAIIAILQAEAIAKRLTFAIHATPAASISAASVVEAGVVLLRRFGDEAALELDVLLREFSITQIAVTADHSAIAREAFRRFGRGRHPASLNFGDCFPYALARALGEPLLFVGDDFLRTDIDVAAY
jgi:ribonuclease VapC